MPLVGPFRQETPKPWGKEVMFARPGAPFQLKEIHINAGARLSLQQHVDKDEAWVLVSGRGGVIYQDDDGTEHTVEFEPGGSWECTGGLVHRLIGITDCIIIEVSTPEKGTTLRLQDDYGRPDETEELRATPNRGWSGAM
jgi:mannose-6-phosphate isomerase